MSSSFVVLVAIITLSFAQFLPTATFSSVFFINYKDFIHSIDIEQKFEEIFCRADNHHNNNSKHTPLH